jgi:hypothetical protein
MIAEFLVEDEKAQICCQILLKTLARRGYHSYRLEIQAMEQMKGAGGYPVCVRAEEHD